MPAKFKVGDKVTSKYFGFIGVVTQVEDLTDSRWSPHTEGTDFEYEVEGQYDYTTGIETIKDYFFEKWLEKVE